MTEIVAVTANKEESFNNAVEVVVAENTAMIEMTAVAAAVVVSLRKKDINTFDSVYIIEWLTFLCQPFFLNFLI